MGDHLLLQYEEAEEAMTGKNDTRWPGRQLPKWQLQHHSCAALYRGTAKHYRLAPDIEPLEPENRVRQR